MGHNQNVFAGMLAYQIDQCWQSARRYGKPALSTRQAQMCMGPFPIRPFRQEIFLPLRVASSPPSGRARFPGNRRMFALGDCAAQRESARFRPSDRAVTRKRRQFFRPLISPQGVGLVRGPLRTTRHRLHPRTDPRRLKRWRHAGTMKTRVAGAVMRSICHGAKFLKRQSSFRAEPRGPRDPPVASRDVPTLLDMTKHCLGLHIAMWKRSQVALHHSPRHGLLLCSH